MRRVAEILRVLVASPADVLTDSAPVGSKGRE